MHTLYINTSEMRTPNSVLSTGSVDPVVSLIKRLKYAAIVLHGCILLISITIPGLQWNHNYSRNIVHTCTLTCTCIWYDVCENEYLCNLCIINISLSFVPCLFCLEAHTLPHYVCLCESIYNSSTILLTTPYLLFEEKDYEKAP